MDGLDHPCKETCSGWKQGKERGQLELAPQITALRNEVRILETCRKEAVKRFHKYRDQRDQFHEELILEREATKVLIEACKKVDELLWDVRKENVEAEILRDALVKAEAIRTGAP
jgi:predicted RNase H-like nuclease (RuvC/YqgF family)